MQQQHALVIGIYKELEPMEKVTYQSSVQTEVIFVKEAAIKKVIGSERKEVPISLSRSLVYLTNQRLIFLKVFEVSAKELGAGANQLAGASGTWYEVPLSAINGVEMRQVQLNKNDLDRFIDFFGEDTAATMLKRPALEILYDEKAATGRAKDYIEAMLRRGALSKLWGRVQMVYDKVWVLGEQSIAIEPVLAEHIRQKVANR